MSSELSSIRAILEIQQQMLDAMLRRMEQTPPANTSSDEVGGMPLAQEITGLSSSRIYTLVSKREMPHMKKGGKLRFKRADLLAWVESGSREKEEDTDETATVA